MYSSNYILKPSFISRTNVQVVQPVEVVPVPQGTVFFPQGSWMELWSPVLVPFFHHDRYQVDHQTPRDWGGGRMANPSSN